jgi:hypothetical protein
MTSKHASWLKAAGSILSKEAHAIQIWELKPDSSDASTWSTWAAHLRNHYCLDELIDELKAGTPYAASRKDYLVALVFPDVKESPGPSIRSGDFSEILVADLVEEQLEYWVPRTQYQAKAVRNESSKGTDVIGFKLQQRNGEFSPQDRLLTVESKAHLSATKPKKAALQAAVDDSIKDEFRKAQTLNAIKRRYLERGSAKEARIVQRFQDPQGNPYRQDSAAAAVICNTVYDAAQVARTTTAKAEPKPTYLFVIRGDAMMSLVHKLYELAASEA